MPRQDLKSITLPEGYASARFKMRDGSMLGPYKSGEAISVNLYDVEVFILDKEWELAESSTFDVALTTSEATA